MNNCGTIKKMTQNSFQIICKAMNLYNKHQKDAVDSILKLTSENTKKETKNLNNFLNNECCCYSKEKKKIYNKYDIDGSLKFNFFESISDLYYRENFHSDILEVLLNPNTKEIGRKYFMQEFINFLGLTSEQFDCRLDFEVIREKENRIDLCIKNKNQAIIVENKINYAPDMANQLVRYMKYVDEDLGIKTYTVVYLTLINDENKKPPIDSYDKCFEKYTNQLKAGNILKEVYAIADKGKKSLENNFLPHCQNKLKEEMENTESEDIKHACNIANIYIEQYRLLLNHLGGIEHMNSTDRKIVEEIYSSEKKFNAAKDFAEFWTSKDRVKNALKEILKDNFCHKFPKKKLQWYKQNGSDEYFWESKDKSFLIFWNGFCEMGFCKSDEKSFTVTKRKELFEIIKTIPKRVYENDDGTWIYCIIADENNINIKEDVLTGLEILFNYSD